MPRSCWIDRASSLAGAALLIGAGSLASAQTPALTAVREGVARNVYISATDEKGAPATDLTPPEITVKEDGASRHVLDVEPASATMQVVLLIDDSGPGIQEVREGVASFIRIVQSSAEIAIVTTAKQNTMLVDFTSDRGALQNAVNRLTTRTTSGGYLLDAIQESARTLVRREAVRPVIVVLALEGTEYSNVSAGQVLEDVRRSGAIVYVVSVGKPAMKTMTSWNQRPTDSIHEALDETIARSTVFAEAPRRSGGRTEQVGQASGIPTRLAEIAYELRDQLVVTYARPQSAKPAEKIEVTVKRRGLKVRAPKWVG
jgi:VWFA-related protein